MTNEYCQESLSLMCAMKTRQRIVRIAERGREKGKKKRGREREDEGRERERRRGKREKTREEREREGRRGREERRERDGYLLPHLLLLRVLLLVKVVFVSRAAVVVLSCE